MTKAPARLKRAEAKVRAKVKAGAKRASSAMRSVKSRARGVVRKVKRAAAKAKRITKRVAPPVLEAAHTMTDAAAFTAGAVTEIVSTMMTNETGEDDEEEAEGA